MARDIPELDAVHTRGDLARALSALRTSAGLTVRELARRVDAPAATLGDYFAGRHLPKASQAELFRAIVTECGAAVADLEHWERALERARFASDGRGAKGTSPYRGLEPFGEGDAELFFGRTAAVTEVLDLLRTLRDQPGPSGGVLVLVGPSGSGKSSLLGAGLVPAVHRGALDTANRRWDCAVTTPAGALDALGPRGGGVRRSNVLVVDQLEELFAAPPASAWRARFLEALAHPAREPDLVVLALRADYYGDAANEPVLLAALRHAQALLGPMTEPELRQAIIGPAQAVGVAIEEGLVDLVLADLAPGSPTDFAHDAGALPLLSHALLVAWQRAQRNQLTIADYRAVGGIRGAVRQTAEELYRSLSPAEQELARRLFARLVRIDDDGPLARRRVHRSELTSLQESGDEIGTFDRVLERFVAARLLTAEADSVQISHEVLLGAWPRLASWIDTDRAGLRLHHQISDGAQAWEASDRDDSLLWRGARLESATEWLGVPTHPEALNGMEKAFLEAAVAHRDGQRRAARLRTRRVQQLFGAAATLALVASLLAAYAFSARSSAIQARGRALSRQVAIEAEQLRTTDPSLAAQLALASYRISPTSQARSALLAASDGEIPTRVLGPIGPEFLAADGGGRLLAVARSATDTVELYSVADRRMRALARLVVGPRSSQDFAVALSPDGRLLAAGDTAGHVDLWSTADPTHPHELATLGGFSSTVYSVAFGPNGRQLAAADNDGSVRQWNLSDPERPLSEPTLHAPERSPMRAVAYSPSGNLAAASGNTGALITWTPGQADATTVAGAGGADLETVAFSPNGGLLATGGNDTDIRLWTVHGTAPLQVARPPLSAGAAFVTCVTFSPDGKVLAACWQSSVLLYDTQTWAQVGNLPVSKPATAAVFSSDGFALTTGDAGGVTRRWQLPAPSSYRVPGKAFSLQYTAAGSLLAVTTSGPTGDVTFYDDRDPLHPRKVADLVMPASFGPVAGAASLDSRDHVMAVASTTAQVQLVDLRDLRHPRPIGPPLQGAKPYIEQLVFTPNGKVLLSGDDSGHVHLWDVAERMRPRALSTLHVTKGEVLSLAVSHNGQLLAACTTDGTIQLYDIADPARPRRLATLGRFASYAYSAAFTPHDRTLVTSSAGGSLRLWSLADPTRPKLETRVLTGLSGYLYQVAISHGGRTLAVATTDHSVGLWDIADPSDPQHLATLDTGTGDLFAVVFDPRGHALAASGNQGVVYFWDYRVNEAARLVCAEAGDPINRTEWQEYVQGAAYAPPCTARGSTR